MLLCIITGCVDACLIAPDAAGHVDVPAGTTSIGGFRGCTSLVSISLPPSITSIGGGAFQGTGLTSVVIPDATTSIANVAFNGASNLKSVTIGVGDHHRG